MHLHASSTGFPKISGLKLDQFKMMLICHWYGWVFWQRIWIIWLVWFLWSFSWNMSKGWFGCSGSSAERSTGWFGGKCGKSTSLDDTFESELFTITVLPSFFLESPLPFTWAFYTDFALGLAALDATGICVGKCTDFDLVLGLPGSRCWCCGPICHKTLYDLSNFVS